MRKQRIFGDSSKHLLKTLNQNLVVLLLNRKCHTTCKFGVKNGLIIFNAKNDAFIFDSENAGPMTFLKIYCNLKM